MVLPARDLAHPPCPPACKMADEAPAAQSRVSRRRRLEQRHQRPLVLEQPAFAIQAAAEAGQLAARPDHAVTGDDDGDRKSTRLNSSHVRISYAVFCLKKKNKHMSPIVSHAARICC